MRSRMEPSVLETADQSPSNESKPIPPNRVQALLGISCVITVTAGLGLAGLHVGASIQVLLVVVGFRLARVVHRCSSDTNWRVPAVLGLAGRAVPTVLLMVGLVAVHQVVTGDLGEGETLAVVSGATFTANIVPFVTGASLPAVDHLWAVALVAQTAVVAPWLLTARRQRVSSRNRALGLLGLAGVAMVGRIVFLATYGPVSNPPIEAGAWLTPPDPSLSGAVAVWTSLDALLIGLAIGTLPLANLHRHPTTRLVTPAVAMLGLLLIVPTVGPPLVDIGVRTGLAAACGGIVLAAEAISGLPGWLNTTLTNAWWHRIGSRAFGMYLWHIPFAAGLTDANPFHVQGLFVFVVVMTLTLAAATTTYRSIELPAQTALASVVSRWYRTDAVLLPSPEPQRGKWIRWDDVSLDRLPIPTRRRSRTSSTTPDDAADGSAVDGLAVDGLAVDGSASADTASTGTASAETASSDDEPLGRRLWKLGDREIDLRPVRRPKPQREEIL